MLANGDTNQTIADANGVSAWTITQWRKDARVRAGVARILEGRVQQVTSKIDSVIAGRLENAETMDTELLLKIRKEYLGGHLRELTTGDKADEGTINSTAEEFEGLAPDQREALLLALGVKSGDSSD